MSVPNSMPEGRSKALQAGHEAFEFDIRYIGWFAAGLVVLLIVTAVAAFYLLGGLRVPQGTAGGAPRADAPGGAPVPVLQSAPASELEAYRQSKQAMLEGYRWVDRSAGIVRLPIERAMQLMVDRGDAPASAPGDGERRR